MYTSLVDIYFNFMELFYDLLNLVITWEGKKFILIILMT